MCRSFPISKIVVNICDPSTPDAEDCVHGLDKKAENELLRSRIAFEHILRFFI